MEMGLDSLAATQLVRELSTKLRVELSPTLLFDHPTVDAINKHVTSIIRVGVGEALASGDEEVNNLIETIMVNRTEWTADVRKEVASKMRSCADRLYQVPL